MLSGGWSPRWRWRRADPRRRRRPARRHEKASRPRLAIRRRSTRRSRTRPSWRTTRRLTAAVVIFVLDGPAAARVVVSSVSTDFVIVILVGLAINDPPAWSVLLREAGFCGDHVHLLPMLLSHLGTGSRAAVSGDAASAGGFYRLIGDRAWTIAPTVARGDVPGKGSSSESESTRLAVVPEERDELQRNAAPSRAHRSSSDLDSHPVRVLRR